MIENPVAELFSLHLAEIYVDVSVAKSDTSVVSVRREVVVLFFD